MEHASALPSTGSLKKYMSLPKPKLGTGNLILVSHVDDSNPITSVVTTASQGMH